MEISTKLLYLGRSPEKYAHTVNTPIYRSSTFVYQTVEELLVEDNPIHTDKSYGRSGTPTVLELQNALKELEHSKHALLTASGLSAITHAILATVKCGEHILVSDACYKCTRRFVDEELPRYGIQYTYYHASDINHLASCIQPNTKAIFMESPGSYTFEVQDVPAIVGLAKEHSLITILDNTWATPIFFQGTLHGVDIVVQSLTKYLSGHADVLMGSICFNSTTADSILARFRNLGSITSPENAYLILRSLRTLHIRLKQHQESAQEISQWLLKQPYVVDVLYPALQSHKQYSIWKRDFSGGSGVFGVVFKKTAKTSLYERINRLKYFGIGLSWGGFESLIVPYDLSSIPSLQTRIQDGNCARLSIGLEAARDLIEDLHQAFKGL